MAKQKDIVEKAPDFMKMNLLDIIMMLDPSKTNKYTPMMVKLFTQNYNQRNVKKGHLYELRTELREIYHVVLDNISDEQTPLIYQFLGSLDSGLVKSMLNFVEAAENKQLPGVDVTQINDISEIHQLMSLIKLKNISKKLQKQVLKDYEDNEWLIIRPFTAEASQKYGYGTKWCTASETYHGHFFNYTQDGKLVYCINKISGKKVAVYYRNNQEKETELSFWNMVDDRVDSMLSELPNSIMDVVRNILFEKDSFTNRELNENAWLTSQSLYKSREKLESVEEAPIARAIRLEREGLPVEEEFFIGEEDMVPNEQLYNVEL